jgi:acetyltransferase-like isoleucine patch superfamily enzyme
MSLSRHRHVVLKGVIKELANILAIGLSAPFWIATRIEGRLFAGRNWFVAGSEFLSLVPGKSGIYLRRAFYRMCLESCSSDCHIGFGTTVAHPEARIGKRVYIGNRCMIGMVRIDDDVVIGSNVDILSGRHQHSFDDPRRPIQEQGGSFRQIRLGRNSWVGNRSIIMADVGSDCVIGAGSVVVKAVPAGSVAVGNPAAVKRQRLLTGQSGSNSPDLISETAISEGAQ